MKWISTAPSITGERSTLTPLFTSMTSFFITEAVLIPSRQILLHDFTVGPAYINCTSYAHFSFASTARRRGATVGLGIWCQLLALPSALPTERSA